MEPDAMSVRLHLRRIRVIAVVVDLVEKLVVEVADTRRVVRCSWCGFKTTRIHDSRRLRVRDLAAHGRPTTLVWVRRRFSCGECSERSWEDHPEILVGRRTHVTRRLARQLVRDVNAMSIREVARRHDLPWHFIMALTRDWSDRVAEERRRRRCRVLLIDETSLRRGHRYVTVLINGDTGQTLGIVAHRNRAALSGFLLAQGHRWLRGVKVVVSDGSGSYRSAIAQHLGHATHVLDRFHVARWFAAGMIEVRRRIQRIAPQGSRPAFKPAIFGPGICSSPASTTCLTTASKPWGGSWPTGPNWKRPGGCSSTSTASTSPKTQTRPTRRLGRSSTFGVNSTRFVGQRSCLFHAATSPWVEVNASRGVLWPWRWMSHSLL